MIVVVFLLLSMRGEQGRDETAQGGKSLWEWRGAEKTMPLFSLRRLTILACLRHNQTTHNDRNKTYGRSNVVCAQSHPVRKRDRSPSVIAWRNSIEIHLWLTLLRRIQPCDPYFSHFFSREREGLCGLLLQRKLWQHVSPSYRLQ